MRSTRRRRAPRAEAATCPTPLLDALLACENPQAAQSAIRVLAPDLPERLLDGVARGRGQPSFVKPMPAPLSLGPLSHLLAYI